MKGSPKLHKSGSDSQLKNRTRSLDKSDLNKSQNSPYYNEKFALKEPRSFSHSKSTISTPFAASKLNQQNTDLMNS